MRHIEREGEVRPRVRCGAAKGDFTAMGMQESINSQGAEIEYMR